MDIAEVLIKFVDHLMPDLTPHEASLYIFLVRHSYLMSGNSEIRMGQRTIAQKYGRGPKMAVPSRSHLLRQINNLEKKGCIRVGDTNRDGTLYSVILPQDIPSVIKKLESILPTQDDNDYFNQPEKRKQIYDRDQWRCQYCGEKVHENNVTLDHFIPKCAGGTNQKENLRTACLLCNSIKSGKTFEEAAPLLLSRVKEIRANSK